MEIDNQACLLLGSNIEPELNIPRAVNLLNEQVTILKMSSIWQSKSVECCYPDYLNLAVLVNCQVDIAGLKEWILLPIEARLGRVRTDNKNAPRTIDIDIIAFNGTVLDQDLWQQVHRAMPVSELLPDQTSPQGELLKDIAMRLAASTPIQLRSDISFNSG